MCKRQNNILIHTSLKQEIKLRELQVIPQDATKLLLTKFKTSFKKTQIDM